MKPRPCAAAGPNRALVTGLVDFLVENRQYAVMAPPTRGGEAQPADDESVAMRRRVLALFYARTRPSPAGRVPRRDQHPESLPDLDDLTDEELREALRTTMLRILRVPA